jgi:hypothetical protein
MTDPAPPSWVTKRDGRLVPFEADKISRALFAAAESLGRPDAFLTRELADGVVFHLARDCEGRTPTTARVAEVVEQVVREFGHAELARAFALQSDKRERQTPPSSSLASVLAAAARRYTLQAVYTRDLAAAREAGLLSLAGLETPGELAGCVLGPPVTVSGDLVADLEEVRRFAGQYVALDGLEHLTAAPADVAASIARGLRLTGLRGVVNLNVAAPPSRVGDLAEGPLFASAQRRPAAGASEELLAHLLQQASPQVRIDWHLAADDFSANPERVRRVVRRALEGADVCFVFDRPRRPIALAEGLDRTHPATLLVAGVHLPALLRQPGMLADPERYRQRLGSLVRLALSAAVQKRDFVRREARRQQTADVTSGFLLDRARFVVVPVGLDEVVRQFTGWGLASGGESLELAKQIVRRLADVLRQDGRSAQMDAVLDGPASFALEGEETAGLTAWDRAASAKSQLRAAGELHAIAGQGTAALLLPEDEPAGVEQLTQWLEAAWRQTEVVRVRLVRPRRGQGELFARAG